MENQNVNTGTENSSAENNASNNETKPTVDELMMQLEVERMESKKRKEALDKALKEKGELTKSLREKMTADEQAEAERKEVEEKRQAEYESAIAELNFLKATKAYSNINDEKIVEGLIKAIDKKDHTAIAKVINAQIENAVKVAKAEWMGNLPDVRTGVEGGALTRKQIMSISDDIERQKAIAENIELFS